MDRQFDRKFDQGKLRHDLVMPEVINELAKVMTYGAEKYSPNSWQLVDDAENRYYAALLRHIYAYRLKEKEDPESGINHLSHAMANLQFLLYFQNKGNEDAPISI